MLSYTYFFFKLGIVFIFHVTIFNRNYVVFTGHLGWTIWPKKKNERCPLRTAGMFLWYCIPRAITFSFFRQHSCTSAFLRVEMYLMVPFNVPYNIVKYKNSLWSEIAPVFFGFQFYGVHSAM